jgi:hypothetical protein
VSGDNLDWVEIRPDEDGEFDEIVARFAGGGMVHVETMTDKSVYIGFYRGREQLQFWISAKKKLHYHHEQSRLPKRKSTRLALAIKPKEQPNDQ